MPDAEFEALEESKKTEEVLNVNEGLEGNAFDFNKLDRGRNDTPTRPSGKAPGNFRRLLVSLDNQVHVVVLLPVVILLCLTFLSLHLCWPRAIILSEDV